MSTVRPRPVSVCALTLLLAFWGTSVAAADLGRLFHTPAERHALDQPHETVVDHGEPDAAPVSRRIDGLLRSSAGRATIWLDAEPLAPAPLFQLAPYPALELIPQPASQLRLHVGDSWPPSARSADSSLPRLHVQRHRDAPR